MHVTSLRVFVDRLSEAQRLGFGDLRRLQRDILPNGPQSREDVEALLALDLALERADRGWPEYLLQVVKGFVLDRRIRPALSALSSPAGSSQCCRRPNRRQPSASPARWCRKEVDEVLRAVAKASARRKPKGRIPRRCSCPAASPIRGKVCGSAARS